MLYYGPLVTGGFKSITVEANGVTNNDITAPSHGFAANTIVRFFAVGGTLPTGLTEDTLYYVIATGLTTDTFRVSTTQGGTAVDITATGSGQVAQDNSRDIRSGDTISFAAGQIQIVDD